MTPEEFKESEEYKKSIKYAFEDVKEKWETLWALNDFKLIAVVFIVGLVLIFKYID